MRAAFTKGTVTGLADGVSRPSRHIRHIRHKIVFIINNVAAVALVADIWRKGWKVALPGVIEVVGGKLSWTLCRTA